MAVSQPSEQPANVEEEIQLGGDDQPRPPLEKKSTLLMIHDQSNLLVKKVGQKFEEIGKSETA